MIKKLLPSKSKQSRRLFALMSEACDLMLSNSNLSNKRRFVFSNSAVYFSIPFSYKTLISLYGKKSASGLVCSLSLRPCLKFNLLDDCVLLKLSFNNGVVLASEKVGKVLKIVEGKKETRKIDNAVAAGINLSQHCELAPLVYENGATLNGKRYMLQELWANTVPVDRKELKQFANVELASKLFKAYQVNGIKSYSIREWLYHLSKKESEILSNSNIMKTLQKLVASSLKVDLVPIHTAVVHGDMSLKHIHRNSNGWRLIDWDNHERGNILEDWISLELKTHRERWQEDSFLSIVLKSNTINELQHYFLLEWPGPILKRIYGDEASDIEVIKLLIYVALIERLVRIEHFTDCNPIEIPWLMEALSHPNSSIQ